MWDPTLEQVCLKCLARYPLTQHRVGYAVSDDLITGYGATLKELSTDSKISLKNRGFWGIRTMGLVAERAICILRYLESKKAAQQQLRHPFLAVFRYIQMSNL